MYHVEFVAAAQVFVFVLFGKHIIAVQYGSLNHQVCTRLIQRYGVCRCQHAEVGNDGGIIMVPAVALRRYVHNETDMEVRFVFQHGNGIFSNLVVQPFGRILVAHYGGVMLAQSYALSASHTFGIVYFRFAFGIQMNGIVGAVFYADIASDTIFGGNFGL